MYETVWLMAEKLVKSVKIQCMVWQIVLVVKLNIKVVAL